MNPPCVPSCEAFYRRVQENSWASHAQMSCPLDFDNLNAITILQALQEQVHFFLLESATAEKTLSRYSFFSYQVERRFRCLGDGTVRLLQQEYREHQPYGPEQLLNTGSDPFSLLFRHSIDAPQPIKVLPLPPSHSVHTPSWQGFQGGLVGMFGYEAVRHMGVLRHDLKQLSTPHSRYGQQPELLFYEVQRFFVLDNASQRLFAVYLQPLPPQRNSVSLGQAHREGEKQLSQMVEDLENKLASVKLGGMLPNLSSTGKQLAAEISKKLWQEDQSEAQQVETLAQLRCELLAGEGLQVVYSVGREGPPVSPSLFYRLLRYGNPSPYMFFFKNEEQHLVGSSPETHLRYQDGVACIKPIAGTRPLPENCSPAELQQIIEDLLGDAKERAEHLMLIDLARNDLYTNCEVDSVQTVKQFEPELYSHVVHIVSEVHGRLRPECKPYELFAKTFPAGTLSGAPKVRAIELIDQYEKSPRGFYGGCIGYFNYDGSFDSAIIIRSAWMDGEKTLTRSGSGLVYDSEPGYEICEHRQKLGILSRVLQAILQESQGTASESRKN